MENAKQHACQLNETGPLHKFWEAFSHNVQNFKLTKFDEYNLKASQFNIKYLDDEKLILQIKLTPVWTTYMRYCKDNNIQALDSNSLRALLTSSGNHDFIPSTQKGRNNSYTDKKFGSCYQFWAKKTESGFIISEVEVYL